MDEKHLISDHEITELIRASKKLKQNETKSGVIVEQKISKAEGFVVRAVFRSDDEDNGRKSNIIPFTASIQNNEEAKFSGFVREDAIKKRKKECLGTRLLSYIKEKMKEISLPEEDLNYYIDNRGRNYIIEDGIRVYLDDRGFEYYLRYDASGVEYEWIPLTNGYIATFANDDHTIVEIDGKYYRMDDEGTIHFEQEISFIGPKR